MTETIGVILRLDGICISQDMLEGRLGCPVRWEKRLADNVQSACIDMTEPDDVIRWDDLGGRLQGMAEAIACLIDDTAIDTAELDIGLPFYGDSMAASVTVPPLFCEQAGRARIAVTISYYMTASEDRSGDGER